MAGQMPGAGQEASPPSTPAAAWLYPSRGHFGLIREDRVLGNLGTWEASPQ